MMSFQSIMAAAILVSLLLIQAASAFQTVTPFTSASKTFALQGKLSSNNDDDDVVSRKSPNAAAVAMASAVIMGHVAMMATSAPALAFDDSNTYFAFQEDAPSQLLAAGRSGGRMGGRSSMSGRSSMGGRSSYSAPSRSYRSSTTTIIRPMIAPPPVVVTPGFGYSPFGYGYNPLGGFGLGYGLGAMNSAGDSIRDYRQESEIQQSKAELEQAKAREAELEQRIRALEQSTNSN